MDRRSFIQLSSFGSAGLAFLPYELSCNTGTLQSEMGEFESLSWNLLRTWCDAMIRDQVDHPNDPVLDGALYCHACDLVHGRCPDSVYPFLFLADKTGEKSYLDAAIKVMQWSVNVDLPDGSWTNMIDPKSWNGTTVFGAIALGEALKHHGHILPQEVKTAWDQRLKRAIDYVYQKFDMEFSHINYRFTAIYALYFLGNYFNEQKYIDRSKEFAAQIPNWLTEPNKLIFGEDSPDDEKSAKGLYPIDIGYNVEESLNGVVQYAVATGDKRLLALLTDSLSGHLEFMLPDGAWDNSFGTRQNKWIYWGSRTTDGCQPAYLLMSDRNPAFAQAVIQSTKLLDRCTVNGLLAGGLHYESHGVKPCMHHTFAHAKNLAYLLENFEILKQNFVETPLPRAASTEVKHFPELDVWLFSKGSWRATVSTYDQIRKKKYSVPATGGALALLWHEDLGPIFTASMAEYIEVEPYNQQEQPGIDFCLTPQVERFVNEVWHANIHDLEAKVKIDKDDEVQKCTVHTVLTNREKDKISKDGGFELIYTFRQELTQIGAKRLSHVNRQDVLVLPVISPTGEMISKISDHEYRIHKPEGILSLRANVPIKIKDSIKERIFNQVPGMEVVPFYLDFVEDLHEITVELSLV